MEKDGHTSVLFSPSSLSTAATNGRRTCGQAPPTALGLHVATSLAPPGATGGLADCHPELSLEDERKVWRKKSSANCPSNFLACLHPHL